MSSEPFRVIVYEIYFQDNPADKYIGSTKNKYLSCRMSIHRQNAKEGSTNKISQLIREKGGDFIYRALGTRVVNNFIEQRMYEQQFIDDRQPSLNCNRSYNSEEYYKEYYMNYESNPENKAKKKKRMAIYNQKPEVKAVVKKRNEINKANIKKYMREYTQSNKDLIYINRKEYRLKNLDKIKANVGQKIFCKFCNKSTTKGNIIRHNNTPTHIFNYIIY